MKAVDTNVVVRYLTGDLPAQAAKARKVIGSGNILVLQSPCWRILLALSHGGN